VEEIRQPFVDVSRREWQLTAFDASNQQMRRTEIKKLLSSRSDRIKAVDLHPTESWILCALYNGKVQVYNYKTQLLLRTSDTAEVPVRAGRFIARKNWLVTGSDDFQLVLRRCFIHFLISACIQLQHPGEDY
jgi:hypothetical protein